MFYIQLIKLSIFIIVSKRDSKIWVISGSLQRFKVVFSGRVLILEGTTSFQILVPICLDYFEGYANQRIFLPFPYDYDLQYLLWHPKFIVLICDIRDDGKCSCRPFYSKSKLGFSSCNGEPVLFRNQRLHLGNNHRDANSQINKET